MPINYAKLATTAKKMISTNGRAVILREFVNEGQEWDPILTPQDTPTKAVVTTAAAHLVDGEIVKAEDRFFLFYSGVKPETNMRIIDGATDYVILNVQTISPADIIVLYKVHARA